MAHTLELIALDWLAQRNAAALSTHHVHRATVEKYKRLTTQPPPISIKGDGRILDGLHRTQVALEKGESWIMCNVQEILAGE
jgi:hypothetical protein